MEANLNNYFDALRSSLTAEMPIAEVQSLVAQAAASGSAPNTNTGGNGLSLGSGAMMTVAVVAIAASGAFYWLLGSSQVEQAIVVQKEEVHVQYIEQPVTASKPLVATSEKSIASESSEFGYNEPAYQHKNAAFEEGGIAPIDTIPDSVQNQKNPLVQELRQLVRHPKPLTVIKGEVSEPSGGGIKLITVHSTDAQSRLDSIENELKKLGIKAHFKPTYQGNSIVALRASLKRKRNIRVLKISGFSEMFIRLRFKENGRLEDFQLSSNCDNNGVFEELSDTDCSKNFVSGFGVFLEDWALIEENGLFGFVNWQCEEVVVPKYDKIKSFSIYREGWAMVELRGLQGFINDSGEEVIAPKYDNISTFDNYRVGWAKVELGGLQGFINDSGEEVIAPKYDNISTFDNYRVGWAVVELNGLQGFIDDHGGEVVKPQYDHISTFDNYRVGWAKVMIDGKVGFISDRGIEVVAPKYDNVSHFDDYREGWARVLVDGKLGFIDDRGREIVNPKYDHISQFDVHAEGLARVTINGKQGFIDRQGKEVVKPGLSNF